MRGAAAYAEVDRASRVAGATPHGLVAILLDEAVAGIDALEVALTRGKRGGDAQVRTAAILHALEASLDHAQGGEAAGLMQRVYRETRRCLARAGQESDPMWCRQARETIKPVAEAWSAIGHA